MSIFSGHFPLGLGTSRFPVSGSGDREGIKKSIDLVVEALNSGMDYIDVAHNYSAGMAPAILKEAFQQTKKPFSVTVKVQYKEDSTADQARRRVEMHLKALGLDHAKYFTSWFIRNYTDFEQIMKKGGVYEGALKLKEEGIIDHICCSMHASPEDMYKIIDSGAFEGATISYSLLNASQMQPVLERALEKNVGIAVMNPLGGGVIAQNKEFFSFACTPKTNEDAVIAALRFVKAHPAVDIVLGGISSREDLNSSLSAFTLPDPELPEIRMKRVMKYVSELKGFCTGCNYCEGCPMGIPTSAIMRAHNALLFEPVESYNRKAPDELLYNLQVFKTLAMDAGWLPETTENPCVNCGYCMEKCTQKLDIVHGVQDIFQRAQKVDFSKKAHSDRIGQLLHEKNYRKVGLYPTGRFYKRVMELYQEQYGKPEFEWILFNSDSKTWGEVVDDQVVHSPEEIPEIRPDIILITNYHFEQEIADALKKYEQEYGIKIEKLHREGTVPWVF